MLLYLRGFISNLVPGQCSPVCVPKIFRNDYNPLPDHNPCTLLMFLKQLYSCWACSTPNDGKWGRYENKAKTAAEIVHFCFRVADGLD